LGLIFPPSCHLPEFLLFDVIISLIDDYQGVDVFHHINKGDFDFEGIGILAFTEIDDEYKPGTTVTGRLVYKGLDLMDVIVEGSWSHSKAEDHPCYMQKELLNKLSVGVEAFF